MIHIGIVVGSTRQSRFGDKPAHWMFDIAKEHEGAEPELLDLRDYALPFYDEPTSPAAIQGGAYGNEAARTWGDKIRAADAFVIVTPEYNHGTSGVLKNALDSVYAEWNDKPVAFVAYGGVGGARAVEHLRGTAIELQMVPIRRAVHIPDPWNLVDEEGNLKAGALEPFIDSAHAMLDQLTWYANALKVARENDKT